MVNGSGGGGCGEQTACYPRARTSKCLQRFSGCCILYLHSLHSMRSVTFFVVFAFFLKTGLDWPP